ncbi:cytochrome P450 [Nocardia sp. IBHARD005]|uniref:cytochrome P450 n=1 Tax=Nocardia sp. IBHARD005 TaxID=3457765 RepID=UPI0040599CA1
MSPQRITTLLPSLRPLDPAVLEDPYPTYRQLRDAGPVCRVSPAAYGVTRHAEVAALLKDPRVSHKFPESDPRFAAQDPVAFELARRIMSTREAPDHTRIRKLVAPAFGPRQVARLRADIAGQVERLFAAGIERGRMDIVNDLALPLAVGTVCGVVGLPDQVRDEIAGRAADLSRAFTPFAMPERTRGAAASALAWLRSIIAEELAQRRYAPRDDLLTNVLGGAEDERLSLEEAIDNVVFVCFTGYETTVNMISNGCAALLRFPDQLALLREDPALVPTAVEEFLRYEAPSQYGAGIAQEPITLGPSTIKPGRVVFLLLGSANHDERVFRHPDRVDVTRSPNPHVSFGGGPHRCVGAALGRAEGEVVFDALARRLIRFEPDGAPVRAPNASMRAYAELPVAIGAA